MRLAALAFTDAEIREMRANEVEARRLGENERAENIAENLRLILGHRKADALENAWTVERFAELLEQHGAPSENIDIAPACHPAERWRASYLFADRVLLLRCATCDKLQTFRIA